MKKPASNNKLIIAKLANDRAAIGDMNPGEALTEFRDALRHGEQVSLIRFMTEAGFDFSCKGHGAILACLQAKRPKSFKTLCPSLNPDSDANSIKLLSRILFQLAASTPSSKKNELSKLLDMAASVSPLLDSSVFDEIMNDKPVADNPTMRSELLRIRLSQTMSASSSASKRSKI